MNYKKLQKELYEANLALQNKGSSTFSHISLYNEEDKVVALKPQGRPLASLKPKDMVIANLDGKVLEGSNPPDDGLVHTLLYKNFKGVKAICFSNDPYGTAWACAKRPIPAYGIPHIRHLSCDIPLTQPLSKSDLNESFHKAVALSIVKLFADSEIVITGMNLGNVTTDSAYVHTECAYTPLDLPMCLVASYGCYSWGVDADSALNSSILLEEMAYNAFLTEKINPKVSRLDEYFIEKYEQTKKV